MVFCEEKSGFLFSHGCTRPAPESCAACGKRVCEQHLHLEDDVQVCTTCAKKARGVRRGRRVRTRAGDRSHGDPYFYGYHHYRGYGWYGTGYWGYHYMTPFYDDPNDFTEADAGSLSGEGGEGFEQDMGGS